MDWNRYKILRKLDINPRGVLNVDCQEVFGSRDKALQQLAHIKEKYGNVQDAGKALLVKLLQDYVAAHPGVRRITPKMMQQSADLPPMREVNRVLGSGVMDDCLREAGLFPNVPTDEELLAALREVRDRLGRAPIRDDLRWGESPYSINAYQTRYGGLTPALELINEEPNQVAPRGKGRRHSAPEAVCYFPTYR